MRDKKILIKERIRNIKYVMIGYIFLGKNVKTWISIIIFKVVHIDNTINNKGNKQLSDGTNNQCVVIKPSVILV